MSYKFLRGNLSGAVGNSDLYVTELSASEKLTLGSAYSFTSAGALTAGAIAGSTVSGSGNVSVGGQLTINDYSITRAGVATLGATSVSTLGASGLASLDGGINVDDKWTVSTAGAASGSSTLHIKGNLLAQEGDFAVSAGGNILSNGTLSVDGLASLDGGINVNDAFTVSAAGAVVAVGVSAGGAISNATTISGSGAGSLASLIVDGGAGSGQIGPYSDPNLLVLAPEALTVNGDVTLGADTGDDVTITGRIAADIDPKADNTYDLGADGLEWKDLYVDGIGYIDAIRVADDSTIGLDSDTDLLTLSSGVLKVAGNVSASAAMEVGTSLSLKQGSGVNGGASNFIFVGNTDEAGLALYFRNNSSQMQGVISMGGTSAANLRLEGDAAKEVAAVLGDADGNAKWRVKDSAEAVLWEVDSDGALSGSGALQASTLKASNTVAAAPTLASDSLVWIDSGVLKSRTFSAYASAIAGTGITATNGVLSVDTTGGDSVSVTDHGDANQVLSGGLNFCSAGITANRTWTLPASPEVGDVVYVKGGAGLDDAKITISRAGAQVIDDSLTSIDLISPNASVGLVFTSASAGTLGWKII